MSLIYPPISQELPVGAVIESSCALGADWKLCDGSVLAQADYPIYVNNCDDLHPLKWKEWGAINLETTDARLSIARKGNIIVVVGTGVSAHYSINGGETWNTNSPFGSYYKFAIGANDNYFVVLESTYARYSSDGINWITGAALPSAIYPEQIKWNGSIFVVIEYGASYYYTSVNGIDWIYRTSPSELSSGYSYSQQLAVGNGYFMFYDYYSNGIVKTSDGINWTLVEIDILFNNVGAISDFALDYADSKFILQFNYGERIYIKSDDNGTTWASVPYPAQYPSSRRENFWHWTGSEVIAVPYGSQRTYGENIIQVGDGNSMRVVPAPISIAKGIVSKAGDYAVILCAEENSMNFVLRADYTEYVSTTHFQLPDLNRALPNGVYKYIKVK